MHLLEHLELLVSESKVTSGKHNLGSAVNLRVKVGGALAIAHPELTFE